MKSMFLSSVIFAILVVGCSEKNNKVEIAKFDVAEKTVQLYSCSIHVEVRGEQGDTCSKCGMDLTNALKQVKGTPKRLELEKGSTFTTVKTNFAIVVTKYLKLKKALVEDVSKAATLAPKKLVVTLSALNYNSLGSDNKTKFTEIATRMKRTYNTLAANLEIWIIRGNTLFW